MVNKYLNLPLFSVKQTVNKIIFNEITGECSVFSKERGVFR
ncbi:MAG: hypothetical protein ACI8W0_001986 [Flavobacterium sp.]|jgi:hypothetical protein